ncbi:tenascin, partial [Clonorchis sinensis]
MDDSTRLFNTIPTRRCPAATSSATPEVRSRTLEESEVAVGSVAAFSFPKDSIHHFGVPKIIAQLSEENFGSRTLSWSVGSTVKTGTFQLTIWSGDSESKVKMQGVNTWTLSDLRPCTFHTIQISPLVDGSPVLEDSSPPMSFVTRGSTSDRPRLNVTHVVPGEVTISWTESKECRGFTYVYALRQYIDGDPKPNEVKKSAETREHIFTGLSPCTRYQYRVVLQASSDGTSVVESGLFELKTLPRTLEGPGLVLASISGSTVDVHWDAVASGTTCAVSEYMVTMTPYNESRSIITAKESGTYITLELEECTWYDITVKAKFTGGEVWSEESKPIAVQSFLRPYPVPDFTIVNLMPGVQKISWPGSIRWIHECVTKYEVVRSLAGDQSTSVHFTMFSGTPASLVPSNVRGKAISFDTVRVTWSALPCSVSGATYTVKAQPTAKARSTRQARITEEELKAGVVELAIEPCTLYAVYMDIDSFGNQNRSQVSMITSMDDLANIAAPNVVVSNVKPGVQKVSWDDMSGRTICDYLYVVTQTNKRNNTVFIRRTTATAKLFVQLEPCTEYEYTVHIQRRKHESAGPKSAPVSLVSKPTKPSTPTLLNVSTMGPTDVSLIWTAPEPPGDCHITGFVITAQPMSVTQETVTALVSGEARSAMLTVDQCTLYAVFLQSKYDEDVFSEKTEFTTISSQSEVPGLPVNLTITKNSPHKQVVIWSAPAEPYNCEHTYEIEQVEFQPTGENKRSVSLPSTFRSHIFQSLKPWTRYSYRIRIVGQPGDKVGPYTEAVERVTEPDRDEAKLVAGLMQAVGATENTITLQLNLTRLPPVPQLNSLSLLVQPQHEQTQVKHESIILDEGLMENTTQTWAERQQSGTGAWEIKLWEKKTEEQTYSFEDRTLILGQDFACEKEVYCETGQLTPGTVYGIQLRIYSTTGSIISRQYFAATRTDMAALGIFVGMVTTVAVAMIILAALVYFGIIPIEVADVTVSSEEQVVQTIEKPKKVKKEKPKKTRKEKRKGKSKAGKLASVPEKPVEPIAMTIEQLKAHLEECLQSPEDRIKEQFS